MRVPPERGPHHVRRTARHVCSSFRFSRVCAGCLRLFGICVRDHHPTPDQRLHRSLKERSASIRPTCTLFVPPVANFVAFTDTVHDLGISFDYAGLSDDPLGGALGTTFSGTISERTVADGSVIVTVRLHTSNALVYVIPFYPTSPDNQFGENPAALLDASVGRPGGRASPRSATATSTLEFTNAAPGLPIPDFEQLLFAPEAGPGRSCRLLFQGSSHRALRRTAGPGKVHVIENGHPRPRLPRRPVRRLPRRVHQPDSLAAPARPVRRATGVEPGEDAAGRARRRVVVDLPVLEVVLSRRNATSSLGGTISSARPPAGGGVRARRRSGRRMGRGPRGVRAPRASATYPRYCRRCRPDC